MQASSSCTLHLVTSGLVLELTRAAMCSLDSCNSRPAVQHAVHSTASPSCNNSPRSNKGSAADQSFARGGAAGSCSAAGATTAAAEPPPPSTQTVHNGGGTAEDKGSGTQDDEEDNDNGGAQGQHLSLILQVINMVLTLLPGPRGSACLGTMPQTHSQASCPSRMLDATAVAATAGACAPA